MIGGQDGLWHSVRGGVEPDPEHPDTNVIVRLSAKNTEGMTVGSKIHMDRGRWEGARARTMEFAMRDLLRWGPIQ